MKKKRQPRKSNAKALAENRRALVNAPASFTEPEPSRPPLAGEALELKVAEVLCGSFRTTAGRDSLRQKCQGADDPAIEAAIVSPRVRTVVEPVARAYALEQVIAVLQLLFSGARDALEKEKPTSAQLTALKIIFEVVVEKLLERIWGGTWQESAGVLFTSDFEKSIVDNMLQLVRRQKAPVAEEPHQIPNSGDDRATANAVDCDLPGVFGG